MGGNLALRERESAEISEGRSRRLFLVLGRDAQAPAPGPAATGVPADEPALRLVKPAAGDAAEVAASEPAVQPAAATAGDPVESHAENGLDAEEGERDWARRVPDGLIVGAAVLGACIGFPIGTAAAGVVTGFFGGLMGALVGAMAVLGIARHLDLVLRVVLVLLGSAIVYELTH